MAVGEQLRFNLNVPCDSDNMSTRFKLKPSPIILQKLQEDSFPCDVPLGLDTRMELASRLARRDLEAAILNPHPLPHTPQSLPTTDIAKSIPTSRVSFKMSTNTTATSKATRACNRVSKGASKASKMTKPALMEDSGIDVSAVSETEEMTISDISDLKKELNDKLRRYCQWLLASQRPPNVELTATDDREMEREMNRIDEQSCRNNRLMYNLQLKVKQYQTNFGKLKKRKDLKDLSLVYRTIIRVINSLMYPLPAYLHCAPVDVKLVDQLIDVIREVSHVTYQTTMTRNKEDQEQKELLLELEFHVESIESFISERTTQIVKSQKKSQRTHVKTRRRLKRPSILKQPQPKQLLFKQHSMLQKTPLSQKDDKSLSLAWKSYAATLTHIPTTQGVIPVSMIPVSSSSTQTNINAPLPDSLAVEKKQTMGGDRMWLDAYTVDRIKHLDKMQEATEKKLMLLQEEMKKLNKERRNTNKEDEIKDNDRSCNERPVEMKGNDNSEISQDRGVSDRGISSLLTRSAVDGLLNKLQQIEKETSQIQGRWPTISYIDPILSTGSTGSCISCRTTVGASTTTTTTTEAGIIITNGAIATSTATSTTNSTRATTVTTGTITATTITARPVTTRAFATTTVTTATTVTARPVTTRAFATTTVTTATTVTARPVTTRAIATTTATTATTATIRAEGAFDDDSFTDQQQSRHIEMKHKTHRKKKNPTKELIENVSEGLIDGLIDGVVGEIEVTLSECVSDLFNNEFHRP